MNKNIYVFIDVVSSATKGSRDDEQQKKKRKKNEHPWETWRARRWPYTTWIHIVCDLSDSRLVSSNIEPWVSAECGHRSTCVAHQLLIRCSMQAASFASFIFIIIYFFTLFFAISTCIIRIAHVKQCVVDCCSANQGGNQLVVWLQLVCCTWAIWRSVHVAWMTNDDVDFLNNQWHFCLWHANYHQSFRQAVYGGVSNNDNRKHCSINVISFYGRFRENRFHSHIPWRSEIMPMHSFISFEWKFHGFKSIKYIVACTPQVE